VSIYFSDVRHKVRAAFILTDELVEMCCKALAVAANPTLGHISWLSPVLGASSWFSFPNTLKWKQFSIASECRNLDKLTENGDMRLGMVVGKRRPERDTATRALEATREGITLLARNNSASR
jgi:hypothetical protein